MPTLIDQLQTEIDSLDNKALWSYLEQSRKMKKEATEIEKIIKDRCKVLMGDSDSLALEGDAGVYVQYSPRYEVSVINAESLVEDKTMLYDILTVDMAKAKEVLPELLFLELQTKKELKGEPTKKLMVGKIKGYERLWNSHGSDGTT